MPTTEIFPGTAAIRTPEAPRLRAMSSAQPVSLLSRTPRSSSTSYRVTLGPRVTLIIWASMLKLARVSLSRREFSRISSVPSAAARAGFFSRSRGGKQYSGFAWLWPSAISAATCRAEAAVSLAVTFPVSSFSGLGISRAAPSRTPGFTGFSAGRFFGSTSSGIFEGLAGFGGSGIRSSTGSSNTSGTSS